MENFKFQDHNNRMGSLLVDIDEDHHEDHNGLDEALSNLRASRIDHNVISDINQASGIDNKNSFDINDSQQLHILTVSFLKSSKFCEEKITQVIEHVKVHSKHTKILMLHLKQCEMMKDDDYERLGAILGSKLEFVEYLFVNIWKGWKSTVDGIHKLINGISGESNSLKSLNIRVREYWNMGNETSRQLLEGLKSSLANLEELSFSSAENTFHTIEGAKDLKEDTNLAEGLARYEINHHLAGIKEFFKDNSNEDIENYIRKAFQGGEMKEGIILTNKLTFSFNKMVKSRLETCKVTL